MKTGVIVARFQVPYLHEGHLHLIDEVRSKSDKVVFCLGEPLVPDIRNPLPYAYRVLMICDMFGENDGSLASWLSFHKIVDHHDDSEWSNHLDAILDNYENVTLYGSRDSFKEFYTGKYPVEIIPEIPSMSGTQIREMVYKNSDSNRWRSGYIAGVQDTLKNLQYEKWKKEQEETP